MPAIPVMDEGFLCEDQYRSYRPFARPYAHEVDEESVEDNIANPELTVQQKAELEKLEHGPMQGEIKYLDRRYNDIGQTYYAATVAEVIEDQGEKANWWSQFALCLVRCFDDPSTRCVSSVELRVNSPHLKAMLKETIQNYPGMSFDTKNVTIPGPYHCLFHYRRELEAADAALAEGSEARQHHGLLMRFIHDQFKDTITETANLLEQGLIECSYLWTIFVPGHVVYSVLDGQDRAFTLKSGSMSRDGYLLMGEFLDFDGSRMGLRDQPLLISLFPGSAKISSLAAYPIEWHTNPDKIKQSLIARGRCWESLAGMHFRNYSGIALDLDAMGKVYCEGKVVIDTKTAHRLKPNKAWQVRGLDGTTAQSPPEETNVNSRRKRQRTMRRADYDSSGQLQDPNMTSWASEKVTAATIEPLTDSQCLLASAMVRGFAFGEKHWLDFFVDQLSPIEWDGDCFSQLVLPTSQKEVVKALVAMHVGGQEGSNDGTNFDDIVKGKGKGLIFVLHGPPGTGKTLTAETVAEYSKRPLYSVSSDDLSVNSADVDKRLSRVLDMASTWKAVLLIDEADIFLERRSLHDLNRNSLVTTFLRVLEYYQGILFLTSNRVSTFDEAFKSRIHVPLKYNALTPAARKVIWRNFLNRAGQGAECLLQDEAALERLALTDINGRQIKNVVRTASSLAKFHGQPLDEQKLRQVIGIHEDFEEELAQS